MAFTVYPLGQLAPQLLGAGATAPVAFTQEAAPDPNFDPPYARVMFLRVAVTGTVAGPVPAPELRLRAGVGPPVLLQTGQTVPIYRGPLASDYVGDAELAADVPGVSRIFVGLDTPAVETWELTVRNTDTTQPVSLTWVVADTLAQTAQPWLAVAPLDLAVLIGADGAASVQVGNRGTGPCQVTALSALPAGFSRTTPLPFTLAPTTSKPLTVAFTAPGTPPPPDGRTTATASLTVVPPDTTAGAQPEHTTQLAITATTQALDVVLLLDDSGSMSWDAAGAFLPPGAPTSRWRELASTANLYLDRLAHFCADRGTVGVVRFPPGDPADPASGDVVNPVTIPRQADVGALTARIAAIVPSGGTPMGDGLERVAGPAGAFFRTDQVSVAADRRRLVLMSDGAHNQGVHNPQEYVAPPHGTAGPGASLADQRIGLFAVAYGIPGASDVDHVLLTRLAAGSLGAPGIHSAQTGGVTASQLTTAFINMIKAGLSTVAAPTDPEAVFDFDGPPVRHRTLLTEYDRSAAFALHWNTPDPARLRLELITPIGERITPDNSGSFGSTVFRQDERHQAYYVGADVLRNDGDPGAPRFGSWTLVVGPDPDSPGKGVEHYAYDVLTDSELLLDVRLDAGTVVAGDPVPVSARLTARGVPVTGAIVVLSATRPTASQANWLATLDIPARALAAADERFTGQDASPLLVKAFAARLAGLSFDPRPQRADQLMIDSDGSGVYRATPPPSPLPERHTFQVTALGSTPDGVDFRREATVEVFSLVRPSRRDAVLAAQPTGRDTLDVVALPLDRFGNVLLLDPATAPGLVLAASGGVFTGDLVSDLDGSYRRPLRFDPPGAVTVALLFGGELVRSLRVVPFAELHYVDTVLDLRPGAVAPANAHADPADVLGNPIGRPDGRFLALGATGEVALAVSGRTIVAAPDDDDITVIVQPGGLRRSFRVDAFDDAQKAWRPLGSSAGLTATFALRRAGLSATSAVRVVDTSGLTRHPDLTPFTDPGARLRGVGIRSIT